MLDDDDDDDDVETSKPSGIAASASATAETSTATENVLDGFQCPICLDCPSSGSEVASISGCTHRFCFDCIGRWADTENKCPLCKERFRTIDRVIPAAPPPPAAAAASEVATGSVTTRRGKRKREREVSAGRNAARRGQRDAAAASAAAAAPSNSRTVEDRNQQSISSLINMAFIEQMLETLATGGHFRAGEHVSVRNLTLAAGPDGRRSIAFRAQGGDSPRSRLFEMLLQPRVRGGGGDSNASSPRPVRFSHATVSIGRDPSRDARRREAAARRRQRASGSASGGSPDQPLVVD